MMPPMQAGSLANRAALTRLQQPQQPGPPEPPPMQPTPPPAHPATTQPQPTQPQAPAPQQPVAQPPPAPDPPQAPQPPPISSFKDGGPKVGAMPRQPKSPQPQMPMPPVWQPKLTPNQNAMNRVQAQPVRQPMPGQADAQQQRSQQMLRSAEEANLKGRQTGKFQEGLKRFGGDRTQALHYALKYGA